LADALAEADGAFVAKVNRLNELAETDRLNPERIVATLRERGKIAAYAPDAEAILTALMPQLRRGDVVAVFSNGKFDGIHDKLLARLRGVLQEVC
jgi:UDP-N-acetylmuramate: L-alanyl-gamma-D-glutamyl-meso-diaminopimelate ligase